MNHSDDAEAYLRRVGQAARTQFRGGFMAISLDEECDTPMPVVVDVSASDRVPALPMKKKNAGKRRRDSDDEGDHVGTEGEKANENVEVSTRTAAASPPPTTTNTAVVEQVTGTAAPAAPNKRISLLDMYFPGNTLKNSSVEVSLSPPVAFVDKTVEAVSAMRERVVRLRSTVGDAEEFLTGRSLDQQVSDGGDPLITTIASVSEQVCKDNWKGVRDLLDDACRRRARSIAELRRQLEQLCRRKASVRMPARHSTSLWRNYLDAHGPECNHVPTLSDMLWTSNACTTLLFALVAQRLLDTTQRCETVSHTLSRLDVVNAGEEDSRSDVSPRTTFISEQPRLSSQLTTDASSLLVFLRCLMPTASSTGYGVWLFICLCALDCPLDPETDRIAHSLFRKCCGHLRTIGSLEGVHGDVRGELWERVTAKAEPADSATHQVKTYTSLSDVGEAELRAISTLIVVLSKFFRQNQNRLITL